MFSKTGHILFYASIVLTIVAASLLSTTFQQQNFAKATISDGSSECTIAEVGMLSSSYMPNCTALNRELPGEPLDSVPTTSFWPLFPAQNQFGKTDTAQKAGLGWTEFTTCEQYMPLQMQNLSKVNSAPLLQLLKTKNESLPELVIDGFTKFNNMISSSLGNALVMLIMYQVGFDTTNLLNTNWTRVDENLQNEAKNLTRLAELVNSTCVQASPPISNGSVCSQNAIVPLTLVPMNSTTSRTFNSSVGTVYSDLEAFYRDLLNVLTTFPAFQPIVTSQPDLLTQFRSVVALIVSCSNPINKSDPWSQNALACSPGAHFPSYLNDQWVLTPLISGKLEAGTLLGAFQSMLAPDFNKSALPQEFQTLSAAAPLVASCAKTAPMESGTIACIESRVGVVAGTIAFNQMYRSLKWPATDLAPAAFTEAIVDQCINSGKNLKAFNNFQSFAIGSIILLWLAPVIAAVLAVVVKCTGSFSARVRQAILAFAGCLAIAAGILITLAALGIYNAPLYRLVKGSACLPQQICYSSNSGVAMILSSLAFAYVGGVLMCVSVFLAKGNPTSQADTTRKIEEEFGPEY